MLLSDAKDFPVINQRDNRNHYLISGSLDALLMGGASILFFITVMVLYKQKAIHTYSITLLFFLSFLVNFPHFLLSYQLLYIDFSHFIFKKFRFFWAAVIVPAIIIVSLILASYLNPQFLLGYFVNALYFFVGWHYIKQVYGVILVTNALQKMFYTKIERAWLQANLYSLWAVSWVWINTTGSLQIFEGVIYSGLKFPIQCMLYCYAAVIITFVTVFFIHLKKYSRESKKPSTAAVVSFFSLYFWTVPLFYNPTFFYCLSFFHSLQYLPFVYIFRRNKVAQTNSGVRSKAFFIRHYGYFLLSIVLGAIFFYFLPRYLDQFKLFDFELFGPTIIMFYFMIFLNIHHYFIDNVIWKNNEEIQKYLFQK